MEQKSEKEFLYVMKNLTSFNELFETTLADMNEKIGYEVVVANVEKPMNANAPILFAPATLNVLDEDAMSFVQTMYEAHMPIILLDTNASEVTSLCAALHEKNAAPATTFNTKLPVFAIECDEDGVCFTFDGRCGQLQNTVDSLIRWLKKESRPSKEELNCLRKNAEEALLTEGNLDILKMAKALVQTSSADIYGKHLETSYYIVSCHLFKSAGLMDGEDWYYVCQMNKLNGSANYNKYWAGTRCDVNGTSWYVGQGEVALHYVDFYEMENYLVEGEEKRPLQAYLERPLPEAASKETTYSASTSFGISGEIGFEYDGSSSGGPKGGVKIGASGSFSSSISFSVSDVTIESHCFEKNNNSAKWRYIFKRAEQNIKAGYWQRLLDPALLSHTTFSPMNTWIWHIPTNQRSKYSSFKSSLRLGEISTISRYSGSQPHKHVGDRNEVTTFDVPLHHPPLLGISDYSLIFGKGKVTKKIEVASQGDFTMSVSSGADWCKAKTLEKGETTTQVLVTVDAIPTTMEEREAYIIIKRATDTMKVHVVQKNSEIE